MSFDNPSDYREGQKVWFHGLKARVVDENFRAHVTDSFFKLWAVPISINGSSGITLAHVEDLKPRGKRK